MKPASTAAPSEERGKLRRELAQLKRDSYDNLRKTKHYGENEYRARLKKRLRREIRRLSRRLRSTPPLVNKEGSAFWPEGHFAYFRHSSRAKRWQKRETFWHKRGLVSSSPSVSLEQPKGGQE